MSSHALSSPHLHPPSFGTTTVPASPMPIPFGALPSLDGQPRRASVAGQNPDPAHSQPPVQLTLVRLRPTRLLDLPRRLMHPPELPEFMQSEDAAQAESVGEGEAKASGSGTSSRGRTGGTKGDGNQGSSKKGKEKQTEPDVQEVADITMEDRASAGRARSTAPPTSPSSIFPEKPPAKKRRAWHRQWNWGITPTFDVKLEDVLQRKHLPPLGLKDFEEWLLFVEGCAENLYFILWLREYTTRYNAWMRQQKQAQRAHSSGAAPMPFAVPPSHSRQQPYAERSMRQTGPFASLHLAMTRVGFGGSSAQGRPPPSPVPSRERDDSASGVGTAPGTPRLGDTHPYRHDPSFPHSASRPTPSSSSFSGEEPDGSDDSEHNYGGSSVPQQRMYRVHSATRQSNKDLSLFYWRAKETFLTPNAPYELLCASSDVLAVFHTGSLGVSDTFRYMHPWANTVEVSRLPPPPDPEVFRELADIVERQLKGSLDRLVLATYNNVGMPRAYCGCGGGFVIGLIGSAPPLASSFALGGPRWYRLLALPGMWLGMTIFISAWYGVCMMIYIFGDLRQLRSFELTKPPKKEKDSRMVLPVQMPLTRPPRPVLTIIPPGSQPRRGSVQSEDIPMDVLRTPTAAAPREADVTEVDEEVEDEAEDETEEETEESEGDDDEEGEDDDEDEPEIEISGPFYDEHPSPEGPATLPMAWDQHHSRPQLHEGERNPLWPDYDGDSAEHATAGFIGSYVYDGTEAASGSAPRAGVAAGARAADVELRRDASACQPLSEFNFDELPPRKVPRPPPTSASAAAPGTTATSATAAASAGVTTSARRSSFATVRPEDARVGRPAKTKADARAHAKEEKAKSKSRSRSPSPAGSSMNASLKARRWWSWWWWQFVEWVQTMCSPENAVDVYEKESRLVGEYPFVRVGAADAGMGMGEGAGAKAGEAGVNALNAQVRAAQTPQSVPQPLNQRLRSGWREGLKKAYLAVPAFASPLTPVLNPLVGRAQWEIVVRSAAMALVLSCVVVGSLLAVPE